ncbi:MAG: excinuclease ABC subunit UvrC [Desulfobacula sp.]|jgi:excinuclease ABC subunit C|uniref:excinuclease ABC subunit UvrC n=1 Tax=Desulfobacula sp. TaxID=2593537 RepID=UPI001D6851D5|nr:excinuclease ABC subunit UvrC [Desulfobacula sp.]MBT3484110.1 excinuclease ABC subunit UvrC [Desulfobacula sp.]MBT3806575.1 excinuclease ABC subunit UvrC [Desulfobacula sp.]MBT4200699.1 excinuclease ABC subunit UvrC [Desulfobacula sp.]MBT4508479.1 excinuclease ABC subunit UvrC [Desulfobacula sp.]
MKDLILEKYRQAPHQPGVYRMLDTKGSTIYVGKAKDLKKRLSSYFIKKNNHDPKTMALLEMIKDFEIIITSSGHEAFILESNLIKEYNPKYNVILKDGKNYPLLRIDMNETYPAIQRVRKIKNDKAHYFGPYSSSNSVNKTLKQIQKIFKLRRCKNTQFKNRSRPCLNFQIKACLGLCCNDVSVVKYKRQVQDAILFLKGRSHKIVKKLKVEMMGHASSREYEKAAEIRDTIFAIENILEKQVVVSPDMIDRDIVAFAADKGRAVITVMIVRSGFLIDTAHYPLNLGFKEPDEILSAFLGQYYKHMEFLPSIILLSRKIENKEEMEYLFAKRKGKKVSIRVPARGEKKRLVEMAHVNASRELEKSLLKEEEERASISMLKDLMRMKSLPTRIECFDNSNLSGQDPVSSMVVFKDGRPYKDGYRKFIIRGLDFQDDYAYMYQVLERRFSKDSSKMPYPDLLVVDGGKGQLSMAVSVLKDLKIENKFMVAGLAKKNEAKGEEFDKIYIPGRSNPLNTSQAKKALYLLQQIRDEAHRFAITFQRKRREKRAGLSVLDTIPGIGPKKKKILLKHFKGITQIKTSSIDEIAGLLGMNKTLAKKVINALNKN